jgi:predicted house-cleaning noncanonical NTP pyrophosphatase (MazG superfamily)
MTEIDALKKTIKSLEDEINELNGNFIVKPASVRASIEKILGLLDKAKKQLQELEHKQQQTKGGFTR